MEPPFTATSPQRVLLSDQTADFLRQHIGEGHWKGEMPSEARLCRDLQVSRVTLRRALDQLTIEKLIESGGQGKRHKILGKVRIASKPRPGSIVRILSPYSFWKAGARLHSILDALSEKLFASGLHVEYEYRPRLFDAYQQAELERLRVIRNTAAWVLFYPTEPMQRWFEGSKLPCIVEGRLYEGVRLPSLFVDAEAVGRHAAGKLRTRGHQKVVQLIAEFTSLNDRLGAKAFQTEAQSLGLKAEVIVYKGDPESVSKAVNSVLVLRPRPTGIYLTCPEDAVTVLCQLHEAKMRIPNDMEILVGGGDPILRQTVPTIASYELDEVKYGKKLANVVLQRIRHPEEKVHVSHQLPEFHPGGTLGTSPISGAQGNELFRRKSR